MKIVKRFDLDIEPSQTIEIPFNSEILGLGAFNGKPAIWALIDTNFKDMKRTLMITAENKEIGPKFNRTNYIGRFEYTGEVGTNTLHVFEE